MSYDDRAKYGTPWITFDNYIIPNSVKKEPAQKRPIRINPMLIAVGAIAVLTFTLCFFTTVQFMDPRSESMVATAQVVDPVPVMSSVNPENASVDLEKFVSENPQQDVTRAETPDILTPTLSITPSQPFESDRPTAVAQGLTPLRTDDVLTDEEKAASLQTAESIISRHTLHMLREGVLAGGYTVETENEGGRKRIVLKTTKAELTSRTMANILRQAAKDGQIEVPASLNTADGDVDMDTLIFNLVQTSLAEDGTAEGAEAARELSRRAFAASDAKTRKVKGERIYIVKPGDSLAYISLQFYGKPSDFQRIFQANRSVLKTPDKIQIGQRLIIPS